MLGSFLKLIFFTGFLAVFLPGSTSYSKSPDWQAVRDKIEKDLALYLSINTTNPPGNENKACFFLKNLLAREGIPSRIAVSPGGGYNLISVLKGKGEKKPILLLNNTDVYGASADGWIFPPFSGQIKEGFLYGRGALETKGMALMELLAYILIKRSGIELKRDLIFLASADGEAFGRAGVKWILESGILGSEPEFVWGKGSFGFNTVLNSNLPVYLLSTGEKRTLMVEITIPTLDMRGPDFKGMDSSKLGSVLSKIAGAFSAAEIGPESMEFFTHLSAGENPLKRILLRNSNLPLVFNVMEKYLKSDRMARELVYGNFVIEEIEYDPKNKGSDLKLKISTNSFSNEKAENISAKVRKTTGLENARVDLRQLLNGNYSDTNNDFYKAIDLSIKKINPGAITAPYVLSRATDLRFFREKGIVSLGLVPIVIDYEILNGIRGLNERIPTDQLLDGIKIIYESLLRMNP